ncbi:VOC family protein [Devosia sp.]|uniref:VOC family protein n=1 Tax=Devosia sp. TaxID=1871048 RepID=UPI002734AC16|nr:VOC family protein [Devosia sp.]MDP2781632.1 VOC family protein [Devosia sp.]
MRTLNYIILAVADPAASAAFYTALLGVEPVENSPGFVLYVLPNGIKLGLWIASEINPAPLPAGGVEITFSEASETDVRATHTQWQGKATILQPPTSMDFGFTFVAADPDGHRLRVFSPPPKPR